MSLRTALLPMVERIRGIPHAMGLRQHVVSVLTRRWDGERAGVGEAVDQETVLTVANGTSNVRVQQVSARDVLASGGSLSEQDIKVGPFTPGYVPDTTVDPAVDDTSREVLFRVTGPGMGPGRWFRRINDSRVPNFSSFLYLRATGAIVSDAAE